MAMTLCDIIPPRKLSAAHRRQSLPTNLNNFQHSNNMMPELIYFIQKITFQAGIHCRTALVALIYLNRAKQRIPKAAIGGHDTCHRMFLASILIASKFLQADEQNTTAKRLISPKSTRVPSDNNNWTHYYAAYPHYYHSSMLIKGPLTNKKLSDICGNGLFPLNEINQLERAFLKLIQYQCWITDQEIQEFVLKHRVDFSL